MASIRVYLKKDVGDRIAELKGRTGSSEFRGALILCEEPGVCYVQLRSVVDLLPPELASEVERVSIVDEWKQGQRRETGFYEQGMATAIVEDVVGGQRLMLKATVWADASNLYIDIRAGRHFPKFSFEKPAGDHVERLKEAGVGFIKELDTLIERTLEEADKAAAGVAKEHGPKVRAAGRTVVDRLNDILFGSAPTQKS